MNKVSVIAVLSVLVVAGLGVQRLWGADAPQDKPAPKIIKVGMPFADADKLATAKYGKGGAFLQIEPPIGPSGNRMEGRDYKIDNRRYLTLLTDTIDGVETVQRILLFATPRPNKVDTVMFSVTEVDLNRL